MNKSIDLIALHGFLGLPSDWQTFVFSRELPIRHWDSPNLWMELARLPRSASCAFATWASAFAERLKKRGNEKPLLLGYSLGGRLAMHAALAAPELFAGLVLVSSHPGLSSDSDRASRRGLDLKWSERFESEEWGSLVEAWNSQNVLAPPPIQERVPNFQTLPRNESDFNRTLLARALRDWSLGAQGDLRAQLQALELPLFMVHGARDEKFSLLANELAAGTGHRLVRIEQAGHRVPWDNPSAFIKSLSQVISEIREVNQPKSFLEHSPLSEKSED